MKKEFIVVRIDASPDGAPYVVVSLSTSKDLENKVLQRPHLEQA